jgi:hypothetical protein
MWLAHDRPYMAVCMFLTISGSVSLFDHKEFHRPQDKKNAKGYNAEVVEDTGCATAPT